MTVDFSRAFELEAGIIIDDTCFLGNDNNSLVFKDSVHTVEKSLNDLLMEKTSTVETFTIPNGYRFVRHGKYTIDHKITIDGKMRV